MNLSPNLCARGAQRRVSLTPWGQASIPPATRRNRADRILAAASIGLGLTDDQPQRVDNTGNENEDCEKKIQPKLQPKTNCQEGGHRRQEDGEDNAEDVHDTNSISGGQSTRVLDIFAADA